MIGQGCRLTIFSIACSEWERLHTSLRHLGLVAQRELAREVGILSKHLLVIVLPVEVSLDDQGHLQVARHRITINLLVLWVVDVVHLDVVVGETAAIDTHLDCHGVFLDVSAVLVLDDGLGQALSDNGVLVDEGGRLQARRLVVTHQLTIPLRAKLG